MKKINKYGLPTNLFASNPATYPLVFKLIFSRQHSVFSSFLPAHTYRLSLENAKVIFRFCLFQTRRTLSFSKSSIFRSLHQNDYQDTKTALLKITTL